MSTEQALQGVVLNLCLQTLLASTIHIMRLSGSSGTKDRPDALGTIIGTVQLIKSGLRWGFPGK